MGGKFLFLLIFAIILCIYPSYTTADVRTFAHVEEKSEPAVPARVLMTRVYDDNTVVARVIRINLAETLDPSQKLCFFNVLSLRFINPNGTVTEKDIQLNIQSFNYCFLMLPDGGRMEFLQYYLIRKNHILVTFYEAKDVNDFRTYGEWGMIIDPDGNEIDRTYFGPIFIDKVTGTITSFGNSLFTLNINPEKGFVRTDNLQQVDENNRATRWQQYRVEPNGNFTMLTNVTITSRVASAHSTVLSTIDEGYAIIFATTTDTIIPNTLPNVLVPRGEVTMIPFGYNQEAGSPLTLYQTSLPNVTFAGLVCDVAFVGVGQTCVLTVIVNDGGPVITGGKFFVQINFLTTGSVISYNAINLISINLTDKTWSVKSLRYGGFLLTNTISNPDTTVKPHKIIYGYIINGTNYLTWEFIDEPVHSNQEGIFIVLPNNTIMVSQLEVGNANWGFLVTDLIKIVGDRDKGYYNVRIEGTDPQIQQIINQKDFTQVSISFYDPVILSNGRLSIYQMSDDQGPILRQVITANTGFSIGNDSKTVSANVLGSTFSVSNGNYFITIDNEFVRDMGYDEALLGIKDNVWSFTTEEVKDKFAPDAAGLLRLTPNGTTTFDNFSPEDRHNFFFNLKNKISRAVPVSTDRLTTIENIQVDTSVNEKQYLVSIGIKETRNENENSVDTIIKLIDIMVRQQDQSPIGQGELTGFIDEEFGFHQSPNLWVKYRTRLVGLFIIIGIFIILFFIAQRKEKEGQNMAILRFGVIMFDLIMDVLFVSTNSKDVPVLYIPSVIFVTLPIAINTSLAFYIITQENTIPEFYQWFAKNGNVASLFTVLAGADIEALTILRSNLAGFSFFKAPFSETAEKTIFWGAFLNIFTEDIPQVVIQIYYRRKTVAYDIIPLLTLISSSVNLIINIIGRLYQATNLMRDLNVSKYDTPNDDNPDDTNNFGDLADVKIVGNTDIKKDGDDEITNENTEKTIKIDEKIIKTDEKTEKTDDKTEKTEKTEEIEKIEVIK